MGADPGPLHVSQALSELIALRGYARRRADNQLQDVWNAAAGEEIAPHTRVAGLNRGVLQVGVSNASLLGELTAFHKPALLKRLQQERPELRIRDLKFKLNTGIGPTVQ